VSKSLILEFRGWAMIRLPTDPDPMDELRGVSGYSFAFGNEPDLDRVVHLQPDPNFTPRSHTPPLGVSVYSAFVSDGVARTEVVALVGATLDLLDRPMLENRNWTLTLPGFEPIHPFNLKISGHGLTIYREAPFDPKHPDTPVYEVPADLLAAQGARGIEYEPETVGRATGIWDGVAIVTARHKALTEELDALRRHGGDPAREAVLIGRIAQLAYGLNNPTDRRVMMRFMVERFGFPMLGKTSVTGDQPAALGGQLDTSQGWSTSFWFGGWDPDLLCCFMEGSLVIPFALEA
jgi:hypothetical protein